MIFYDWLLTQTNRDDHIGDLAKEVQRDMPQCDIEMLYQAAIIARIGWRVNLWDVQKALDDALIEYRNTDEYKAMATATGYKWNSATIPYLPEYYES